MDYSCFLYDSSAKEHIYKLNKIQNQALRIIGGFIRTTPIHVMESEVCVTPLHLRRLYLAYKFYLKSLACNNNQTIQLVQELQERLNLPYWRTRKKPLLVFAANECKDIDVHSTNNFEMYSLPIWMSYVKLNGVIEHNLECVSGSKRSHEGTSLKFEIIKEINTKYLGYARYYTDGSKNANGLGAAYCNLRDGSIAMYKTRADLSIMTMELIAISRSLDSIASSGGRYVVILTDSKSALQHLTRCASGVRGVPVAYEVLKKIDTLAKEEKELKLQWVPSHVGIKGNEEADRLAKLAVTEGIYIDVKPYYTEVLFKIRRKCRTNYVEYFKESSKYKGIWYSAIQSEPPRIPWFVETRLNRQMIVLAHRIRSGHIPSKSFGFLMKKEESPDCEFCGSVDDAYHLLMECVRNKNERDLLMRDLGLGRYDMGVFIHILAAPTSEAAERVFKMLKHLLASS